MSINDLMEMDLTPVLTIICVLFVIFGIILLPKLKAKNGEIYGDDVLEYDSTVKQASLIARRTAPNPYNHTVSVNYALFEFEDGGRVELAIKDNDIYSTMLEGDSGILRYKDKKFISFKRGESISDVQKPEEPVTETGIDLEECALPVKIKKHGTGKTFCPNCGAPQPDDRYCCYKCAAPFMNNNPDIPYWCDTCGTPGPYEGECPKCGKQSKIFNE